MGCRFMTKHTHYTFHNQHHDLRSLEHVVSIESVDVFLFVFFFSLCVMQNIIRLFIFILVVFFILLLLMFTFYSPFIWLSYIIFYGGLMVHNLIVCLKILSKKRSPRTLHNNMAYVIVSKSCTPKCICFMLNVVE